MKLRLIIILLFCFTFLLAVACQAEPPGDANTATAVVEVTDTREIETQPAEQPTDRPTMIASVEPSPIPSDTAVPEITPTATLPPIQQTVQAMAAMVTVSASDSSSPVIAEDDYPALLEHSCEIVRDNYVRDNYNGVDWDAICAQYQEQVATIPDQESFWDLMEAFIGELNDNHSRFVRPDRFAVEFDLPTEASGQLWPGLIVRPAREDQQLLIWNVCDVGPAAEAGLIRGDVILAINDQQVIRGEDGFNREELYGALYGNLDEVVLEVQRGPGRDPETITVPFGGAAGCDGWSYGLASESPRIGYIRIYDFSGNSDENILFAIEQMEEERPLDGLILDVRHNPGGNSDSDIAVFTTGTFGKVGPLREDGTQSIYRIRGPVRWNETTPVALLIDGASHSAAEYFATALQQAGRAILVGMPTAGNTEGISGFSLPDGSLIRLAIMTLELPDGTTLEGIGVLPDIQVPLGEWGLRQLPDIQLQAAYDALVEQIAQ